MFIQNYKNIVLSENYAKKILAIFNEKTLPLLRVKRATKLNNSNAMAIMSFIAKNVCVEDSLLWIETHSVIDGKPQAFSRVLSTFNIDGTIYYHGINASKLASDNGGYPNFYQAYKTDDELERVLSSYGHQKEYEPKEEEPKGLFAEFEEKDDSPISEEKPQKVEVQEEVPVAQEPKAPNINQEQLIEMTRELVLKELDTYRMVLNDDAKAQLNAALEGSIDEITRRLANLQGTEKIVVLNGEEQKLPQALYHKQFKQLLNLIANKFNIYLYGEAGDGKSHLVKQCADALGLNFYTQTPSDVIGLLGYTDINGEFQDTPFTLWVKNGGLLYLSEFDNVGDAILSINTALANGYITINKTRYNLHKDCVFVADGNTKGNGTNAVYCGRNAIDGATLDRFLFVELEHDSDLELKLSMDNKEWMAFINEFRKIRDTKRVKCLATMRATINMARLEQIQYPITAGLENVLLKGLPKDIEKMMADEIAVRLPSNKYAKAFSEVAR